MDFAVPGDHRIKLKGGEYRDKSQNLAQVLKISKEYKGDSDTNCNFCTWNSHQRIGITGQVETIKITVIVRRGQETSEGLLSFKLQLKSNSLGWCEKKFKGLIIVKKLAVKMYNKHAIWTTLV